MDIPYHYNLFFARLQRNISQKLKYLIFINTVTKKKNGTRTYFEMSYTLEVIIGLSLSNEQFPIRTRSIPISSHIWTRRANSFQEMTLIQGFGASYLYFLQDVFINVNVDNINKWLPCIPGFSHIKEQTEI